MAFYEIIVLKAILKLGMNRLTISRTLLKWGNLQATVILNAT